MAKLNVNLKQGIHVHLSSLFLSTDLNIQKFSHCTREINIRIDIAKEAFNRKISLFTSKLNIKLKKKLEYASETWKLRKLERKYLESSEMWCWRRMEKTNWSEKSLDV
jgi:hypothetical protein